MITVFKQKGESQWDVKNKAIRLRAADCVCPLFSPRSFLLYGGSERADERWEHSNELRKYIPECVGKRKKLVKTMANE